MANPARYSRPPSRRPAAATTTVKALLLLLLACSPLLSPSLWQCNAFQLAPPPSTGRRLPRLCAPAAALARNAPLGASPNGDDEEAAAPVSATTAAATTAAAAAGEEEEAPSVRHAATSSSSPSAHRAFDNFDYGAHWYPAIWARDLPPETPVKVTLFDVDYVVAKIASEDGKEEEDQVIAMRDECPHKKAALSEGRVIVPKPADAAGCGPMFQCSYHGWSFDASSAGECVDIPQVAVARRAAPGRGRRDREGQNPKRRREDGYAVAARIVQGMVFLHPTLTPLEALAAEQTGSLIPPPRVPEMDLPGYKFTPVVRDFPVDWPVLLENIMDPDHGLFAHGGPTGLSFDLYAADGRDYKQSLEEQSINEGRGWMVTSRVDAVKKLTKFDKIVREGEKGAEEVEDGAPLDKIFRRGRSRKKGKGEKKAGEDDDAPLVATTTFVAPSVVYMGRRSPTTNETAFLTAFWICPVGTGRVRFMSAGVGKLPFSLPRWLVHANVNNFLDQDTYLLLGQQRAVLAAEAKAAAQAAEVKDERPSSSSTNVRKSQYVYRSPSEKLGMRVGQFFDATLSRVPNRLSTLRSALLGGDDPAAMRLRPLPSRREILDRYEQHTRICPDSMAVVRNCDRVSRLSKAVALGTVLAQAWSMICKGGASAAGATGAAGVLQSLLRPPSPLRPAPLVAVLLVTALTNFLAKKIRKQFFFKADEVWHFKDVESIPKVWVDPPRRAMTDTTMDL